MRFYNGADDIAWLRETHLKDVRSALPVPVFQSFVLHGNEDCPQRIELYDSREPKYTDSPLAVYVLRTDEARFYWSDERLED